MIRIFNTRACYSNAVLFVQNFPFS
ncbi:hypothetical protein PSAB6_430063 [Paraburkholderia sabiae]|nr:hypothetical protein PSAB6_430063 [Paraburkholderia sabiae]